MTASPNRPSDRPIAIRTAPIAALFVCLLDSGTVQAQDLAVLPVTIELSPGQAAVSLTIANQGTAETSVQIRAFAWSQPNADGEDLLVPVTAVAASPPLATIPPAGTQIVRMLVRDPPQDTEATYRILVDQIPPPAEQGVVQVVLRLSIPVFAEPPGRLFPHLEFHVERDAGELYLVAVNDGKRHEKIHDIALTTDIGAKLTPEGNASPYILAGATRRWHIVDQSQLPAGAGTVRLTAQTEAGAVDQPVNVLAAP